ncbi:MAG: FMN-binding protein [Mycobacterium leprae]
MANTVNNGPTTQKPVAGKPANGKMGKKMVALCSAAIGAIYAAGYVVTLPGSAQAAGIMNTNTTAAAPQTQQQQTVPGPGGRHRGHDGEGFHGDDGQTAGIYGQGKTNTYGGSQGSTTTAPSSSSTAKTGSYKDGTYTGSGTNRFGTVSVAVTIKSGKISNVQITGCNTHYPESYISRLPSQVISRQSAQVDFVTGATRSSEDFQAAVQQALRQAIG